MKKIILPGLVAGLIMLVLGFATSYLFMIFPSVAADYANTNIMRSWSDPLMSLFFVSPFILGIGLAWVWNRTKTLFSGTLWRRGANFGLIYFLIATIPGMIMSYSSFPLSFLTVLSWTIGGLLNGIISGWVLVKMNN